MIVNKKNIHISNITKLTSIHIHRLFTTVMILSLEIITYLYCLFCRNATFVPAALRMGQLPLIVSMEYCR